MQSTGLTGLGSVDLTSFSTFSGSVGSSPPTAILENPIALLTTPIQNLLGSILGAQGTSSVIDSIFGNLVSFGQAVFDLAQNLCTLHLKVPGVTDLIENYVLGGRSLNLLRIISLFAAIPAVIEGKLSGNSSPAPVSFADSSSTVPFSTWGPWLNVALGSVFGILTGCQVASSVAFVNDPSGGSNVGLYQKEQAVLELVIGMLCLARGMVGFGFDQADTTAQTDWQYANSALDCALAISQGVAGALYLQAGGLATAAQNVTGALSAVFTLGQVVVTIGCAASGAVQSPADWSAFALGSASTICLGAQRFNLWMVQNKWINAGTGLRATLGFGVSTAAFEIGAAIADSLSTFNY
jgi:hypothetical protein